jgi:hypothetical protein
MHSNGGGTRLQFVVLLCLFLAGTVAASRADDPVPDSDSAIGATSFYVVGYLPEYRAAD